VSVWINAQLFMVGLDPVTFLRSDTLQLGVILMDYCTHAHTPF